MQTQNPSHWYVCYMLAALYLVANVDRFIINLMVESIKRDFVLSDTEVSLLIGITFSLFYVLCGIPIARFADRSNRRNILTAGVAAWSLMTATAGLAQNFWHLFLARVGVGIGEATVAPCAHSMMADVLPAEKLGRGFAIYSLGAVLGGALAFVIGGPLIAWSASAFPQGVNLPLIGNIFSWQIVFLIVGFPGVLIALIFFLTVAEPKRQTKNEQETPMRFDDVMAFIRQHKILFLSIYGGIALLQIAAGGFSAWMPALLERRFDIGPAEAAPFLVLAIIIPGFASSLTAGWIGDTLLKQGVHDAHLRVVTYATAIGALPFGLATLAPSAEMMIGLFAVGYFFVFMQVILCPTALQLISPPRMRSVSASLVMVATILIGAGTGPTIVALITDYVFNDEGKVHLSLAAVSLICTLLTVAAFAMGVKPYGEIIRKTHKGIRSNTTDQATPLFPAFASVKQWSNTTRHLTRKFFRRLSMIQQTWVLRRFRPSGRPPKK